MDVLNFGQYLDILNNMNQNLTAQVRSQTVPLMTMMSDKVTYCLLSLS